MKQTNGHNLNNSVSCIIGAGYSFVAGLPLASDLLTTEVAVVSNESAKRFHAVWKHYRKWLDENSNGYPEEYLSYLFEGHSSQSPPFSYAVELIAAALATPRGQDKKAKSPRYSIRVIQPTHCNIHVHFWRIVYQNFDNVFAITTNYDLLIERALRHRPMKRGFGPGCYYGGIEFPQILRGNALPFTVKRPMRRIELSGDIPIYKLHGSLNWSYRDRQLYMYQDMRPAFRYGGDAAIVPPVTLKRIPDWLSAIWNEAEVALSSSSTWIICGYSLPEYDKGIREFLSGASKESLKRIILIDPKSNVIQDSYQEIAPNTDILCLSGLPDALCELEQII
jgi:hypothetical protein